MARSALCVAVAAIALADASAGEIPPLTRTFQRVDGQFTVNLDINGTAHTLDLSEGAYGTFDVKDNSPDDPQPRLGRTTSGRPIGLWQVPASTQFMTEVDGGRIKIRMFPVRPHLPYARIYAHIVVDFGGDWKGDTVFMAMDPADWRLDPDMPMTFDRFTEVSHKTWLFTGLEGPRMFGRTLFDDEVNGRQFTVSIRDFGFGEWPDLTLSSVPEPTSAALLAIPILVLTRRRRW